MRLEDLRRIRVELTKVKFGAPEKTMDNPCWKGYVAYGTKIKDGVEVPNCIPDPEAMEKENFVIPTPNGGESQDEYVSRCMGVIGGEDKPQDQLVAICIATYENK